VSLFFVGSVDGIVLAQGNPLCETELNTVIDGSLRIETICVRCARRQSSEQFHHLCHMVDRKDAEPTGSCRLHHLLPQHQVADVDGGNDDNLLPGQAAGRADHKQAFGLLEKPADGLELPVLVDRDGDRQRLF
jgi:hypothetical protein